MAYTGPKLVVDCRLADDMDEVHEVVESLGMKRVMEPYPNFMTVPLTRASYRAGYFSSDSFCEVMEKEGYTVITAEEFLGAIRRGRNEA